MRCLRISGELPRRSVPSFCSSRPSSLPRGICADKPEQCGQKDANQSTCFYRGAWTEVLQTSRHFRQANPKMRTCCSQQSVILSIHTTSEPGTEKVNPWLKGSSLDRRYLCLEVLRWGLVIVACSWSRDGCNEFHDFYLCHASIWGICCYM